MSTQHLLTLVLVLPSLGGLTAIVLAILRSRSPLIARHLANLALPFCLLPLIAALLLSSGGAGAGIAILIVLLQVISGATESHMAGHVQWLEGRRGGRGGADGAGD